MSYNSFHTLAKWQPIVCLRFHTLAKRQTIVCLGFSGLPYFKIIAVLGGKVERLSEWGLFICSMKCESRFFLFCRFYIKIMYMK